MSERWCGIPADEWNRQRGQSTVYLDHGLTADMLQPCRAVQSAVCRVPSGLLETHMDTQLALPVSLFPVRSDTPEIARGTTLYDTVPAGNGGADSGETAAAVQHEVSGTLAVGECGRSEVEAGDEGPQSKQMQGGTEAEGVVQGVPGCGQAGGRKGGEEAGGRGAGTRPGVEGAGACAASEAVASSRRHHRQRHRQREGKQLASGQGCDQGLDGSGAGATSLAGGGGEGGLGDTGCEKAAARTPAAPPVAAAGGAAASGSPARNPGSSRTTQATASSSASAPCPPGWTRSSRGPVPPRAGRYIGLARTAMSRQVGRRGEGGLRERYGMVGKRGQGGRTAAGVRGGPGAGCQEAVRAPRARGRGDTRSHV